MKGQTKDQTASKELLLPDILVFVSVLDQNRPRASFALTLCNPVTSGRFAYQPCLGSNLYGPGHITTELTAGHDTISVKLHRMIVLEMLSVFAITCCKHGA